MPAFATCGKGFEGCRPLSIDSRTWLGIAVGLGRVWSEARLKLVLTKRIMQDRQWFVLYVLVCLEVGIFLILVPWSAIWERNYFLLAYPRLGTVVLDPTFRGAVSGLGIANLYVVLHDVVGRRRQAGLTTTELFPGGVHFESRQSTESGKQTPASEATDEPQALVSGAKSSQNVV